ncbi:MAG: hypothetical protein MPJ50_07305 [Pirellulales bacterium]|nr:hypothetical protein [Pirellulales bacterium]
MCDQPIAEDAIGRHSSLASRLTSFGLDGVLSPVPQMFTFGKLLFLAFLFLAFLTGCGEDSPPQKRTQSIHGQGSEKPKQPFEKQNSTESPNFGETSAHQSPQATGGGTDLVNASSQSGNQTAKTTAKPFDLTKATERFLFLTPQGPAIVELVISIDGMPYQTALEGLIDRLLQIADGAEPLTWKQALQDARFLGLRMNQPPASDMDLPSQIEQWDSNGNTLADAEEVRAYISADTTGGDAEVTAATVAIDSSATRTVLDRWWRSIDTNRDGHLSQEEAHTVEALLRRHDTDDDDVVRLRDILPSQMATNTSGREVAPRLAMHVTDLLNWNTVSYELDERYYLDGGLSAASFPLDPDLFNLLDLSGDGYLRTKEVERLGEIAPHLIINVNLGESDHRPAGLHVLSSLSLLMPIEESSSALEEATFDISGSRLTFRSADADGMEAAQQAAKSFIRRFDANQDGYLDVEEASVNPLTAGDRFSVLDANANKMLVADEIETALAWSQAARLTEITITVRSEERSVFSALDINGDGRITAREMQSAGDRLMSLDADGNGTIQYSELPTSISVEVRRADGSVNVDTTNEESLRWFAAMDTNDDGDVSRREFLGSDEQFKMLDTNDDGLVDQEEARAAGEFSQSWNAPFTAAPAGAHNFVAVRRLSRGDWTARLMLNQPDLRCQT